MKNGEHEFAAMAHCSHSTNGITPDRHPVERTSRGAPNVSSPPSDLIWSHGGLQPVPMAGGRGRGSTIGIPLVDGLAYAVSSLGRTDGGDDVGAVEVGRWR